MRSGDLGKPAGNWLQRGLGHLVGPRGFLADAVDQLGLVPREVELREHPDSPGLGVNIGTTASVDEAIAMGRRFLEEAAAHDRKREGIWVWYTRPSGALTRIYVQPEPDQTPPDYNAFHGPLTQLSPMPPWGGGTWTSDQVNSPDFAVSPSDAARRVVERPWDTAVPENPITKEEPPMQDEKLADRLLREEKEAALERERNLERSAPVGDGDGIPNKAINVLRPTKAKVHITGDGTGKGTTVALQVPEADGDGLEEIPINNVTWLSLNQGLDGPGYATITTVAMDHPVDVVLDAEIGPKQLTELRIRLFHTDNDDQHLVEFVELEDQDGEGVGHFERVDEGEGYSYMRIPIKPWPGEGEVPDEVRRLRAQIAATLPALKACKVRDLSMQARDAIAILDREAEGEEPLNPMVNSHVETARRLLAQARPALEGADVPAFTKLDGAAMTVLDAIDELDKAPIIPGGIYAELKHAIARGDAGQQVIDVLEKEMKRKQAEAADLRSAVAAALPVVRELLEHHSLNPSGMQAIGELERIAVGANPEYAAGMAAARAHIAELEDRAADEQAARRQMAARQTAYEASSRVLLQHLAGQNPAWWVEAGEALKRLHDLVEPSHLAGAAENTAEEKRP